MTSNREMFFIKLLELLELYDADFYYTTDDDGVHFQLGGKNPTPGFYNRKELKNWMDRDI